MILALGLIYLLISNKDKVARYIYAFTIWTLICFAMTELLSLFKAINTKNLYLSWFIVILILFLVNLCKGTIKVFCNKLVRWKSGNYDRVTYCWLFFSIIMIGLAIKTVPYNSDSMAYHLARLFHWAENSSVEYYATSINRQVASPILASYINIHVYVMSNCNDRLINLLQCFSYLTCGWLVYRIANKIGCSTKYSNIARILFYSMPIAFGEALTTQVDNFASLWMLALIYLLIDLLNKENKFIFSKDLSLRVIILSLCVGFGYLTKPSVCIGMLFFAIWLLGVVIYRRDSAYIVGMYILLAILILGGMLVPGFYRNMITFDALSAPGVGKRQLIGTLSPLYVLINCIKNFTFNMPTIWINNSTQLIYTVVTFLARMLQVDIDNPAISEDGNAFGVHRALQYGHDTAVNPIIVWLLVILFFVLVFRKNRIRAVEKSGIMLNYFEAASISFIVFCALLRWEHFVSRYMISYLAVLCPAIAGVMELFWLSVRNKKYFKIEKYINGIVYLVCLVELFGLFGYHGRIALEESRYAGYFYNRGQVKSNYYDIAEIVNTGGYENIGLMLDGNSFEYPLLVMLNGYDRIEHVNVVNRTVIYEDESFLPDIIISIEREIEEDVLMCHGRPYELYEIIDEDVYLWVQKE